MATYGNRKDKRYAYGLFEHKIGDIDILGWYIMYYIPTILLISDGDGEVMEQIRYSNFGEKNITRKDLHGTRQRLMRKAYILKG